MRIVLASASPSRKQILLSAGIQPILAPADIDEAAIITELADTAPEKVVKKLAQAKAEAIANDYPNDVIIGGDSMLLIDGVLQGKPHTVAETITRWHNQRGKTGHLLTGHYICYGTHSYSKTSATAVHFGLASDNDIKAYAHSGEPLGCAGAFTLEALGGWFIDRIEGDPSSVIGLSLPVVRQALYSFGLQISDFWPRAKTTIS
ncbi:Maf-like protein [Corynebacterium kutscheri]|uniref:Nucleoside triphosphate pyrophosphatase n=1 Tax=Corynebacterium kutscheri TaxID=35755 RepID=A0A0F6QZE9_9CORY|nr:nucleoside triphosphate pyrophosphatase [Corynebacterium kutscheri]AKE40680.1 MAF protein [Corynebacterium kutscheri]VEH04716.1 Maf-like protein [Corynebacterium kutscheri]VEH11077.1 Maf-like protein [Corynebacterium kutscheri]VEH80445.1 Maf-like protein [Corynebacterium kutscheri]